MNKALCVLIGYQVDGALEEAVEGFALEHAVLKKGEVDELMDYGIVLGVVGEDGVLLFTLLVDGLLGVGLVVFLFLCEFVVLLL